MSVMGGGKEGLQFANNVAGSGDPLKCVGGLGMVWGPLVVHQKLGSTPLVSHNLPSAHRWCIRTFYPIPFLSQRSSTTVVRQKDMQLSQYYFCS